MRISVYLATAALGVALAGAKPALACGGCGCCAMGMSGMGMYGMGMYGMGMYGMPMYGMGMPGMASPGNMAGMNMPNSPRDPARSVPPVQAAQTKKVVLAVSGMHCADCSARVRQALASVPGVGQEQVNYDMGLAVIRVEAGKYDEQALLQALQKADYGGKVLK